MLLLLKVGEVGKKIGAGVPVKEDLVRVAGVVGVKDVVNSLLLSPVLTALTERVVVLTLLLIPVNETYGVKEGLSIGGKSYGFAVLIGVDNVLCAATGVVVVLLKLFLELSLHKVEIVNESAVALVIKNVLVHLCGKSVKELVLGKSLTLIVFLDNLIKSIVKTSNTVACKSLESFLEVLLLALVGGLSTVLLKTNDLSRVDGRATVVCGIKIYVKVEKNVLHSEGATVTELNIILKYEAVTGICYLGICVDLVKNSTVSKNILRLIVKYDTSLILTVRYSTVLIGRKHTELSHTNNGAVSSGRGIEGVKYAVKLRGSKNERKLLIVDDGLFSTTNESCERAHQKTYYQNERNCLL